MANMATKKDTYKKVKSVVEKATEQMPEGTEAEEERPDEDFEVNQAIPMAAKRKKEKRLLARLKKAKGVDDFTKYQPSTPVTGSN